MQPNPQAVAYALLVKHSHTKAADVLPMALLRNPKAVESRPFAVQFDPKAVEVKLLGCKLMV